VNWQDQGTAFANPSYSAGWSGLLNADLVAGIIRASDNVQTPGLKLWTFGPQGLNIDVNDSAKWVRPTIEMWHGVTPEFWSRGTMAAKEVRQWKQSFFPTMGLKEVTAASEDGAMYLSASKGATDTTLSVAATLTVPNQTVRVSLRLGGSAVTEQDVVVSASDATTATATVPNSKASAGAAFEAVFSQGDKTLLTGKTSLQ
jgi:hypothetical protein